MPRLNGLLALAVLLTAQHAALPATRPVVAIEDVSIVDVVTGTSSAPRTVLCADGRITRIAQPGEVEVPPLAVRVNGHGKFLIRGLTDMHVHLFNNATHREPNDWALPL